MAAIIVAVDANNGIGFNNNLLEHIPEDMKRFKDLTTDNIVIMGRKTYDSLPNRPLKDRLNYIITRDIRYDPKNDNVTFVNLNEAKMIIHMFNWSFFKKKIKTFIIGGGQIYKELLPCCDEIYMTKILTTHNQVDAYFPDLNPDDWSGIMESSGTYKDIEYQFWHYSRKS